MHKCIRSGRTPHLHQCLSPLRGNVSVYNFVGSSMQPPPANCGARTRTVSRLIARSEAYALNRVVRSRWDSGVRRIAEVPDRSSLRCKWRRCSPREAAGGGRGPSQDGEGLASAHGRTDNGRDRRGRGRRRPILLEVAAILEKRWNSYAGAFADTTLPVVMRAIILDALARSIGSEPIAAAIALTARTFLPRQGSKADQALWSELLDDAERRLERRAQREWSFPSSADGRTETPTLPQLPAISHTTIKREWLAERIAGAVGPHAEGGAAVAGANPNWANAGEQWSHDFTKRMTKAIGEALDTIAKNNFDRLNAQLTAAYQAQPLAAYVNEVADEFGARSLGLERRSALLWWKEARSRPRLALATVHSSQRSPPHGWHWTRWTSPVPSRRGWQRRSWPRPYCRSTRRGFLPRLP